MNLPELPMGHEWDCSFNESTGVFTVATRSQDTGRAVYIALHPEDEMMTTDSFHDSLTRAMDNAASLRWRGIPKRDIARAVINSQDRISV